MRDREHPTPDLLLRFLRGEGSKTENRAIIRHLLAGCAACSATIRKTWGLADEWPRPVRQQPDAEPPRLAPRFQWIRGRKS